MWASNSQSEAHQVTEVRSSLGHKVKRAASRRGAADTAPYREDVEVTPYYRK